MIGATPPSSNEATSGPELIEVSMPLRAQFASSLRALIASLGADIGFSIDELDDLRLALSEIFSTLVEASPDDSRALISVTLTPGELLISIRRPGTDATYTLDALAMNILEAVTDTYEVGAGGVTFSKRGTELGDRSHRS
jgi:anti-sigma regulatory factor (Ser/Thr protein kinase)